jgi:hypothetical protein
VCTVAVGVCGDLCRALESHILAYSDDIVRCLLQCLQNTGINRYKLIHAITIAQYVTALAYNVRVIYHVRRFMDDNRYCGDLQVHSL